MSAAASAQLFLKKLRQNLHLDRTFLRTPAVGRSERTRYLFDKYRAIATNKGCVNYLGAPFAYDNRWTPALLQGYPAEVLRLHRLVDLSSAHSVLDVGANIGQFAATAIGMFGHLRIWSVEPNPDVLPLLQRNRARADSWKVVPIGVAARDEKRQLHFVPGKSAQGSVYRENAALGLLTGSPVEVTVDLRELTPSLCEELGMPTSYDLIKVDVEGFERDALAGLRGVRWRYLAVETSVARAGAIGAGELRELVAELWGAEPQILHSSATDVESATGDVVLGWPESS